MRTSGADTSHRAAEAQREAFRRMGPEGRLRAAFEMSEEMRSVLEDGVRARRPGATDSELRRETLRLLYGAALADRVTRAARRG